MFSIHRVSIPGARKALKGKMAESFSINTVRASSCLVMLLDGGGGERYRDCHVRKDAHSLEHARHSRR